MAQDDSRPDKPSGDAEKEKAAASARKRIRGALLRGGGLAGLFTAAAAGSWVYLVGPQNAVTAVTALAAVDADNSNDAPAYFELEEITANLSAGRTPHFIRVQYVLQAPASETERFEALAPQMLDALQEYIRQQNPSDIQGGAGFYRFKSESLHRLRLVAGPDSIDDLHITSLLTQ